MTRPPDITDDWRTSCASCTLPCSDGSIGEAPACALRYMDELRLTMGVASSGGSLNGDPSIGLTGVESANGLRASVGVAGLGPCSASAAVPYGGGAVAEDADLCTPAVAAVAAPAAAAPPSSPAPVSDMFGG